MSHQQLLQGFQKGTIEINAQVSVLTRDGYKTYFVDEDSLFFHRDDDKAGEAHALATLIDITRLCAGSGDRTLSAWNTLSDSDELVA